MAGPPDPLYDGHVFYSPHVLWPSTVGIAYPRTLLWPYPVPADRDEPGTLYDAHLRYDPHLLWPVPVAGEAHPSTLDEHYPDVGPHTTVAAASTGLTFPQFIYEFAPTDGPLVASPTWVDMGDCQSWEVSAGRQHELNRPEAGTGTFLFDNRDGRWSPWNTASVHWHGGLGLKPMRQMRVRAVWAGVTYPVWRGYIEAFPMVWPDPVNADVDLGVVDMLALLNLPKLTGLGYQAAVTADSPHAYWRLGDDPGTPGVADTSGNGYTGTRQLSVAPGAQGAFPTDTDTAYDFGARAGWIDCPTAAAMSGTGPWSVEAWINTSDTASTGGLATVLYIGDLPDRTASHRLKVQVNPLTGNVWVTGPGIFLAGTRTVNDGVYHHIAVTYTAGALTIYVDGKLDVTSPQTMSAAITASVVWIAAQNYVDGFFDRFAAAWDGQLDEVAIYTTALSAARVLAHYQAGASPGVGQTADQRINAVLDIVGVPAGMRSIDTSSTVLQAITTTLSSTSVLQHIQDVVNTEGGNLYVSRDGKIVFHSRQWPLTPPNNAVTATLGDGAGEIPFELHGSQFGMDSLDIWNEAVVSRVGGPTITLDDATSQGQYGPRTLQGKTGLLYAFDEVGVSLAAYYLRIYKDPQPRVQAITLRPYDSPTAMFPLVLGADLEQRYTVKRAGIPGDAFNQANNVEHIKLHVEQGVVEATWGMAPADTTNYAIFGVSTFDDGSTFMP